MSIDLEALRTACAEVVDSTLWQTPNPKDLSDIIVTDEIARLKKAYLEIALEHVEFVEGEGRDPDLITRAVLYLAVAHAIPPMKDDIRWFHDMLQALVEIACPNYFHTEESGRFLEDVQEGVRIAQRYIEGDVPDKSS